MKKEIKSACTSVKAKLVELGIIEKSHIHLKRNSIVPKLIMLGVPRDRLGHFQNGLEVAFNGDRNRIATYLDFKIRHKNDLS